MQISNTHHRSLPFVFFSNMIPQLEKPARTASSLQQEATSLPVYCLLPAFTCNIYNQKHSLGIFRTAALAKQEVTSPAAHTLLVIITDYKNTVLLLSVSRRDLVSRPFTWTLSNQPLQNRAAVFLLCSVDDKIRCEASQCG